MLVTIVRVSDQTRRVEYEPVEMAEIKEESIIEKYGRCENGEIVYVKVDGNLEMELHYKSQLKDYRRIK